MQTEIESRARPDRRKWFREYMQRLNPTSPAQSVISLGLASKSLHNSLYKRMATRADLDPGSHQLLVGGIGSGKTTELLFTQQFLNAELKSLALYIDISYETDLSGVNSGALLASLGQHLLKAFHVLNMEANPSELLRVQSELNLFAFGGSVLTPSPEDTESEAKLMPKTIGKLKSPIPNLARDIKEIGSSLKFLLAAIQTKHSDVVVIFDGLDRLPTPEKFWSVTYQDFIAMRDLGISAIAVAPISVLYSSASILEQFDRVHHIPAVQVDGAASNRLVSILVQRGAGSLILENELVRIAELSGGVLRDLITLARDAGEMAYLQGNDQVQLTDVQLAARQLGEGYLRGLGPNQIQILRKLITDRAIDVSSQAGLELLATRRVLEYSGTDFRVHPALTPLI